MTDDLVLAEMLAARLCHDLAGPVGATAAGAELLDDLGSDGLDSDTLALVAASAAGAAARLKFFRAAFGPAGQSQRVPALRDLAEAYLAATTSAAAPTLALDWRIAAAELPADLARLLLNLLLVARDALPRGGAIEVALTDSGGHVVARGTPALLADEARLVLVEGLPPAGPRGAQATLAARLAARLSSSIVLGAADGEVAMTFGL